MPFPCPAGIVYVLQESDEVRHFAFQVIESIVSKEWGNLPEENRSTLKETALGFYCNCTKSITEEKQFIKGNSISISITKG